MSGLGVGSGNGSGHGSGNATPSGQGMPPIEEETHGDDHGSGIATPSGQVMPPIEEETHGDGPETTPDPAADPSSETHGNRIDDLRSFLSSASFSIAGPNNDKPRSSGTRRFLT
jgi:hypothetical protein